MADNSEDSWRLTNLGEIGGAKDVALRAEAARTEESFDGAGTAAGTEVWRVEKFELERVEQRARNLSLYSGDAYLILQTTELEDGGFDYALHYWIGKDSTQDEAAAVAYFAVALDDLLGQKPVQYREVQGQETKLFHSYFGSVVYLNGGIASGFKKVEPEAYEPRLLQMNGSGNNVRVTQVEMNPSVLNNADVFILDNGVTAYQFNAPGSSVFEKRRAMEIIEQDLKAERGDLELVILDGEEELLECADFWSVLGCESPESLPDASEKRSLAMRDDTDSFQEKTLFKLSDDSGALSIIRVQQGSLEADLVNSDDVWMIVCDGSCFVYVGANASSDEKLYVRMHMDKILQVLGLSSFTRTTYLGQGRSCDAWKRLFE